jgi:hypothetical protein
MKAPDIHPPFSARISLPSQCSLFLLSFFVVSVSSIIVYPSKQSQKRRLPNFKCEWLSGLSGHPSTK